MIIAEIGQAHLGNMELAKKLIVLAKENGADLCKFQLYSHETLYKNHPEIPNVELSFDQAKMLFDYGQKIGIEVFFSVFDVERVDWCERIGVKRYKIAYSQRNNEELISSIPRNKFLIISTPYDGQSNPVVASFYVSYLYGVPKYPAQLSDICFRTELSDDIWDIVDGFSDHTIGLDVAKIALSCGAQIIEKHFALDHKTGVDAPWSMDGVELAELKRWEGVCKRVLG